MPKKDANESSNRIDELSLLTHKDLKHIEKRLRLQFAKERDKQKRRDRQELYQLKRGQKEIISHLANQKFTLEKPYVPISV
jgi:hypothetical protein